MDGFCEFLKERLDSLKEGNKMYVVGCEAITNEGNVEKVYVTHCYNPKDDFYEFEISNEDESYFSFANISNVDAIQDFVFEWSENRNISKVKVNKEEAKSKKISKEI